jgi:hypothetical protein
MQSVEWEREALTSHMITLKHLQSAANIAENQIAPSCTICDNEAEFDISDEEAVVASGASQLSADVRHTILVEEEQIYLPSNGCLAQVEILLQKNQASWLLNQLQELIADKSFQYSHIIQVLGQVF